MDWEYYEEYINKETKGRYDVTPIFENYEVFSNLLSDLGNGFSGFDKIVGLDALGFILGGALAQKVEKGFIPIRKKGKLPGETVGVDFIDYTGKKKGFEINKNAIKKGDKVLIVDEWIETGAQMKAAVKLIEKLKGEVVGISVLSSHRNDKTKVLFEKYGLKAIRIVED